ncbi:hypothetical protein BaRGS_00031855, partial [Batillaria attramentaria]
MSPDYPPSCPANHAAPDKACQRPLPSSQRFVIASVQTDQRSGVSVIIGRIGKRFRSDRKPEGRWENGQKKNARQVYEQQGTPQMLCRKVH